ncbi:hypothetical protein [Desmospora activa]|uniref:Uncharacterized protein n=1 Tax=Desmospora activa DSM 45169 TaxID=1121389 RepID=A0A2T4YYX9_9BACL|nr:hypothetical protein [Desmospora activa]PTM51931.1 hypothetical protein C8J48_3755 [Desmospora activa DSM 45169]
MATIEISKIVTGGTTDLVASYRFNQEAAAEKAFNEIGVYETVRNIGDFLVDLKYHGDQVATFITNETGVRQIENKFK